MLTLAFAAFLVIAAQSEGGAPPFNPDAARYDAQAKNLVGIPLPGDTNAPSLTSGKEGFVYVVAGSYLLVGPVVGYGMAMGINAGLLWSTARALGSNQRTKTTSRLTGLVFVSPMLLFTGPQLMREAIVTLLLSLGVIALYLAPPRRAVYTSALAVGMLTTFRPLTAACLAVGIVVHLGFEHRKQALKVFTWLPVGAAVALALGRLTPLGQLMQVRPADFSSNRDVTSRASRTGFELVQTDTWPQLLRYIPRSLVRFTAEPNIWNVTTSVDLLFLLDTLVWISALIVLWRRRSVASQRTWAVAIGVATSLSLVYASTVGDFGQMLRGRAQVLLVLGLSQIMASDSETRLGFDGVRRTRIRRTEGNSSERKSAATSDVRASSHERAAIGYHPQVSMQAGVKELCDWRKTERATDVP